jgi:hypothetical protein
LTKGGKQFIEIYRNFSKNQIEIVANNSENPTPTSNPKPNRNSYLIYQEKRVTSKPLILLDLIGFHYVDDLTNT